MEDKLSIEEELKIFRKEIKKVTKAWRERIGAQSVIVRVFATSYDDGTEIEIRYDECEAHKNNF